MLLRFGFQAAHDRSSACTDGSYPSISVVVAARNEEAHLRTLLPILASLDYPDYEVLIVDDGSTDGTAEVVRTFAAADARFRLVPVEPAEPRKKNALTAGIGAAQQDLIALTDADCSPSERWLREVAAHFGNAADDRIVIGYAPYDRAPTLVNRLARYENLVTSFLTAAACGLGRPYMAVGRNMAYSRSLFERVGGLEATMRSLSGDDDLFVQEAVRRTGADVIHMFSGGSAVPSPAPATWRSWLRQKRRHVSAGRHYRSSARWHLAVFHASGLGLWLAPFLLGWTGAGLLAVRLGVLHVVMRRAADVFGERDLLPLQPLWELGYSLYVLIVAPVGLLSQPDMWHTGADR